MIAITSVIPYFVLSFIFLLVPMFTVVKYIKFFHKIAYNSCKSKYESLDGLRGFLSLGVFFHHSIVSYNYFQTGIWQAPQSAFYTLLGESSVCFFFMITGFLFWSKAIAKGGKFDIKSLYISRFFRIFPMYIVSTILVFFVVLVASEFNLKIGILNLFVQLFRWITCGLLGAPDINGVAASIVIAKVTWTLRFELLFYLALPFLATLAKPKRFSCLFIFVILVHLINPSSIVLVKIVNFLFGMAAAHIVNRFNLNKICSNQWFSIIPVVILATMPFIFSSGYSILASTFVFIVFLSFLYDNNFFGLLIAPASKYIGTISYSIYLLHGIVLYVVLHAIDKFFPIKMLNPVSYWLIIGGCGLVVILLSGITYRFVEHPFIRPLAKVQPS